MKRLTLGTKLWEIGLFVGGSLAVMAFASSGGLVPLGQRWLSVGIDVACSAALILKQEYVMRLVYSARRLGGKTGKFASILSPALGICALAMIKVVLYLPAGWQLDDIGLLKGLFGSALGAVGLWCLLRAYPVRLWRAYRWHKKRFRDPASRRSRVLRHVRNVTKLPDLRKPS